jgi:hypothetical protein
LNGFQKGTLKHHSQATKDKISIAQKGKPRRKGHRWEHSESAKAKLRGNINRRLRPFESLYHTLKKSASQPTRKWLSGKEFTLTYEEFLLIWTIRRLKIEGDRLGTCIQSLQP